VYPYGERTNLEEGAGGASLESSWKISAKMVNGSWKQEGRKKQPNQSRDLSGAPAAVVI